MFKLPFVFISTSRLKKLQRAQILAEEKLAEQLAWLKMQRDLASSALHSMVEGVLAVDQEGKIILANLALEKMFAVTEPEILGRTVREGLRNNEITDVVAEVLRSCAAVTKQIDIVVPMEKSFVAHAAPINQQQGILSGVVCVLHDVT